MLVSDSGGTQEECTVIGRPLAVVRHSTERPEVMVDFARLVPGGHGLGGVVAEFVDQGPALLAHLATLPSPFGDGTASDRITDALGALTGIDFLAEPSSVI